MPALAGSSRRGRARGMRARGVGALHVRCCSPPTHGPAAQGAARLLLRLRGAWLTREPLDQAGASFFVQALGVALLAHLNGHLRARE